MIAGFSQVFDEVLVCNLATLFESIYGFVDLGLDVAIVDERF